jgi:hypothetical protein
VFRFGLANSSSHQRVVDGLIRFIVDAGDPAFEGLRVGEASQDVKLHTCDGKTLHWPLVLFYERG